MDKYLGKRLDGRYEMRELIGVGGMAYVYKAYDAVDDRIVAVKILKDEYLNSDEFVRRFRNESKAIAILNHPNIVKVLDVGFGERLQYIVMEYIDGITLKEYLDQRKDIRWKEAVHFTVQILRALQHAHDKGIVHRDIKPQNIMLLSDGTIKVTDFGIARLTRSDMKATVEGNKAIGSVHYISPEQARGEITDEKTDLYSVGIMLYETLTGCLPFEADNAVSVAIMQMQSEAKAPHLINDEIPEGLEQITLKAMQKDTTKRYQSAAEMLSDFDEFKRNPSIKFEYTYMVDETPTRYVDAITRVRGESVDTKPKTEEKAAPARKKNVGMLVFLLIMILLVVGGIVAFVIWLVNFLGAGGGFKKKVEEITVDKYIGMMYREEIENNSEYTDKFDFEVKWEDANDPTRAVGEVFKQSPAAGEKVKKGATIILYVNNDTPDAVVIDVRYENEFIGKPQNEVYDILQEAGLKPSYVYQSHETIPADHVIGTDVVFGKEYSYGSTVKVYVSTGASTEEPKAVPDIQGLSAEEASQRLKEVGFRNVSNELKVENYVGDTLIEQGIVMGIIVGGERQDTMPTELPPDANITLIVSSGFKDVAINLEWPYVKDSMIVVRVTVDGSYNTDMAKDFINGIKPSTTSKKLSFTLTDHPTTEKYWFEVEVAVKNDTSIGAYQMYAKAYVDPVSGAVELTVNKHLPGITDTVVIDLGGMSVVGRTVDEVKTALAGVNVVLVETTMNSDIHPAGTVMYLEADGVGVVDGDVLSAGSTVTIVVSGGPASSEPDVPANPENPSGSGSNTPIEQ